MKQAVPQFGWMGPDQEMVEVTNRTGAAVVVGDCLTLDHRRRDVASTSQTLGLSTAGLANAILSNATVNAVAPVASDLATGVYGIVMKAAIDDARTRLLLAGYAASGSVSAAVVLATVGPISAPTSGTDGIMQIVTVANSGAAAALTRKIIFIPLTATGGAGVTDGWFDGVNGFGSVLV